MKKVIVMFFAAMMAVLWSVPALAEYWNDGRSGDSWEDAYIIDSVEDLIMMNRPSVEQIQINNGKYFVLASEIDLTSETGWMGFKFNGHFDGQGHTIRINIQENRVNAGLFHSVSSASGSIAVRKLNVIGDVKVNMGGAVIYLLESGIV